MMNRRLLLAAGVGGMLPLSACATNPPPGGPAPGGSDPRYGVAPGEPAPGAGTRPTYTREELTRAGSNFLGVTAEAVGGAIERIARDQGQEPSAYIAGEEGSGAIGVGLRYGRGLLYLKSGGQPLEVFWQGPSVGWDLGGNAARVFTLAYGLWFPDAIFRRYPGVEGSAYLVGGLGVNYQAADGIVLAPIRAGVGLRLGASVGYLAYSRQRNVLPF